MADTTEISSAGRAVKIPQHLGLFYGGRWHEPVAGGTFETRNPATGELLATVSDAGPEDVDRAVAAAREAFVEWRRVKPTERAALVQELAEVIRQHAEELGILDSADCGNPVNKTVFDANSAARGMEYFAGLAMEVKGETIPMGEGVINYTLRQPLGVVGRIIPFNHPVMFAAMRIAAPLVAGCTIVIKPPEQSPLSALRLAELIGERVPAGVVSILPGGRECGAALSKHPGIDKIALIGSVPTGKAVLHAAADSVKRVVLELGGKNPLIAYPDADPEKVAAGAVAGMNFTWCGQSCGSNSRVFLHEDIHDAVLERILDRVGKLRIGIPTDPDSEVGCLVSQAQLEKVERYVAWGKEEGATLKAGGRRPDDPALRNGFFYEPTVFADVEPQMRIAREEIFGPVMSVFKWKDEAQMLAAVNDVDYGLTASVWTGSLSCAHRAAEAVEAGYIWVNHSSSHFIGAPFGGFKQSGLGREECLEELLDYTEVKNVHVKFEV